MWSPLLTSAATFASSCSNPSLLSWNHLSTLCAAMLPVLSWIFLAILATAAKDATYAAPEIARRSCSPRPPSRIGSFAQRHSSLLSFVLSPASAMILSSCFFIITAWCARAVRTVSGSSIRHRCIGTVLLQYFSSTYSSWVSWILFK